MVETRVIRSMKWGALGLIMVLALLHLPLLASRWAFQSGIEKMHLGDWEGARVRFEGAGDFLALVPVNLLGLRDGVRIREKQGICLQELALGLWRTQAKHARAYSLFQDSRRLLVQARDAEPLNYTVAYALARTQAGLDILFPLVSLNDREPGRAHHLFQRAMELKPNGIEVRYAYAKYLDQQGPREEIPGLIREILEKYPPAYADLSKESFFTPDRLDQAGQGLARALERGVNPRAALQGLSDLQFRRNRYEDAARFYAQSLEHRAFRNRDFHLLHLGRLYLAAGDGTGARRGFREALFCPGISMPPWNRFLTNTGR
ncbi:MAG: hypothetical protein MI747_02150 [Desulfobacterales bacterium]|nr:hypothetical protein [Desulfobacterales bacterium]